MNTMIRDGRLDSGGFFEGGSVTYRITLGRFIILGLVASALAGTVAGLAAGSVLLGIVAGIGVFFALQLLYLAFMALRAEDPAASDSAVAPDRSKHAKAASQRQSSIEN